MHLLFERNAPLLARLPENHPDERILAGFFDQVGAGEPGKNKVEVTMVSFPSCRMRGQRESLQALLNHDSGLVEERAMKFCREINIRKWIQCLGYCFATPREGILHSAAELKKC
jgi:hypothetical protein